MFRCRGIICSGFKRATTSLLLSLAFFAWSISDCTKKLICLYSLRLSADCVLLFGWKRILRDNGVLDMAALVFYPLLLYMYVYICTYNSLSCTSNVYLVLCLPSSCIETV